MAADSETRKIIARRVIERARLRGAPIDEDPAFVALLDEWISGNIDMKQMRDCYLDILALKEAERRGRLAQRKG
jgi:type III secretion system FlhB-like substrate exporter